MSPGDPKLIDWNGFKVNPSNVPLERAGGYRFTNLISLKAYNGISINVAHRCAGHPSGAKKFENAVAKYGKESFICEPVFYLIDTDISKDDRQLLLELETDHIALTNSVSNGYNIKAADGGVGPYGPEHGLACVEGWAKLSPEQRRSGPTRFWDRRGRKPKASKLTPEQRSEKARQDIAKLTPKQRSDRMTRAWANLTPEQRSERGRKRNDKLTPEEHSKRCKAGWAKLTPEQRSEVARKANATRKARRVNPEDTSS